jgi:protease secretion system outer membrane protein
MRHLAHFSGLAAARTVSCALSIAWCALSPALAQSAVPTQNSPAARPLSPVYALMAARAADPRFKADRFELMAARQDGAIARSELYPNAAYALRGSKTLGHLDSDTAVGGATRRELDYVNRNSGLTARQALFNAEAWARSDSADARVAAAESIFLGRESDLLTRVSVAYLDLAMAHEDVRLASSQIESYSEQSRAATRRLQLGDGTRTEVADAQTRLEQARVNLIDAQGALQVARRSLSQITGLPDADTYRLKAEGGWTGLEPQTEADWINLALARNPFLQAQEHTINAAQREADARRNARLPKLDLIGSFTFASNDSLSTLSQKSLQRSLGVALTVPILTGGRLHASEVQAAALTEKERSDLQALADQVLLEVRRQYVIAQAASDKLASLRRAIDASQLAVQGTEAGFRSGTRSFWEVLEAQRRMFVAEREHIRAVRDTLVARVRLQAVSGTLTDEAVAALGQSMR